MQSAYVWPKAGKGPATVTNFRYFEDPDYRDLVLFNEYFNGDTGRCLDGSRQIEWEALMVSCIESVRNISNKRHRL